MGVPAICAFTNLPIEDNTPVVFTLVEARLWHDLIFRPFDAYAPSAPFISANYREDGYLDFDDGEAERMTAHMRTIGVKFDPSSLQTFRLATEGQRASGFFPYMIRKDTWDFIPSLTLAEYPGRVTIADEEVDLRKKTDRRLKDFSESKADGWMSMALHDLLRPFNLSEGQKYRMYDLVEKKLKSSYDTTMEQDREMLEPLYDVRRLWLALHYTRRSVFPHYIGGPQNFDHYNHVAIADFIKQVAVTEGLPSDTDLGY